uniref:Uncharacterized protein n=1 Tax=Ascaris lumbricoides TaxID=6252 RepID=A0A0M3HF47_ASCLU
MTLFRRQPKTSVRTAPVKRARARVACHCTTKGPSFTVSSLNLCVRVVL